MAGLDEEAIGAVLAEFDADAALVSGPGRSHEPEVVAAAYERIGRHVQRLRDLGHFTREQERWL